MRASFPKTWSPLKSVFFFSLLGKSQSFKCATFFPVFEANLLFYYDLKNEITCIIIHKKVRLTAMHDKLEQNLLDIVIYVSRLGTPVRVLDGGQMM